LFSGVCFFCERHEKKKKGFVWEKLDFLAAEQVMGNISYTDNLYPNYHKLNNQWYLSDDLKQTP